VQHGVLTHDQVRKALDFQKRDGQKRKLGECILAMKLTTEERILEVLSHSLKVQVIDLRFETPSRDALALVSFKEADRQLILPLRIELESKRRTLLLVMADPTNLETIDLLQFRLGMTVKPMLATMNQVKTAIIEHYRDRHAVAIDEHPTATASGPAQPPNGNEPTWVGIPGKASDVAELKVMSGPSSGRTIRLARGTSLVFGRSPDVDIVIPDMRLSRRHFSVSHSRGGVEVRDLESSNGTTLNGRVMKQSPLKTGDAIEAGATKIVVQVLGR
jgi:hypothetical protein